MTQCIYCRRSGVQFSREHVIPKAFGSFGSKTMVLNNEVCLDCNTRLGKELDEVLARDTYEAQIRAEWLLPRRQKKDKFKARRIIVKAPDQPEFAEYRGAKFAIDWETRKLKPLDQVIVRDESGRLHAFTIEELPNANDALFQNRPPKGTQLIGMPDKVIELQRWLEAKGAHFASEPTELEPPPAAIEGSILLEVEGLIDQPVWRAIAKIAFNYLAKIHGAAYVLDEKFDRIRDFIRGKATDRALVRLNLRPILAVETRRFKTTGMHLVLFERQGSSLLGRVSLFNSFTYDVMLCPDLGLIYQIKSGHAFDPAEKKLHSLVGISRSLIVRSRARLR